MLENTGNVNSFILEVKNVLFKLVLSETIIYFIFSPKKQKRKPFTPVAFNISD